ncbi:MAG: tetratricopeptide repeat protein [Flavisolibacter sp.]|nr:tetratricopeptide repeat protein [Flavisolibacter sp.]
MDRIERLKEFLAANPSDSFVQHALALEYVKQGNDEQARKLFQNVLQQNEKYIGTYYHLAKLLERNGAIKEAIAVYEKGIMKAMEVNDQHALNELQAAYDDLMY